MTPSKPIIMSAPMVRAILDGRKSQTRRVVRNSEQDNTIYWNPVVVNGYGGWVNEHGRPRPCPYFVGQHLWVKETLEWKSGCDSLMSHFYKADGRHVSRRPDPDDTRWLPTKTVPSIFMPRWASRITLKVEEVRVQRLQDINDEDCRAEGVFGYPAGYYKGCWQSEYSVLWDSLNKKKHPWSSNPWVWAVTFSVAEGPKE